MTIDGARNGSKVGDVVGLAKFGVLVPNQK